MNNLDLQVNGIGTISAPLQVVLLLTLLSFLPAILVTMTSFTRIVIVFHFLRQALGTQEMPSNQILIGLALFLTMFIMAPVGEQINDAGAAAGDGRQDHGDRGARARHAAAARVHAEADARSRSRRCSSSSARSPRPKTRRDLPMRVVIPAFVISELKTGFQMGFFLFVPFLLIDLVVSTTLLSMGMMQLPPAMISLPFKVLLFVMIDGWNLLVGVARAQLRSEAVMSEALVVGIVRQAIELAIMVSLPMLLAGLVAGVLVSVFQTVTSIQDNVLAFIPRAAAIFVGLRADLPVDAAADDRLRAAADRAACPSSCGDRTVAAIARFGLLLVRPGMLVLAAPAFGGTFAPAPVRIGLTLLLGASLVPVIGVPRRPTPACARRSIAARGGDRPGARAGGARR